MARSAPDSSYTDREGNHLRTCLLLVALPALAHTPVSTKITYTQEISRLVAKRCLGCHGPKSAAPLATYDEVRAWSVAIREEVQERRMPPWQAVRGFGDFRDDLSLTQPEIDLWVNWIEGGTPKGDDVYLPPAEPVLPPETTTLGPGLDVAGQAGLQRPLMVEGIRPVRIAEGGWLQATAMLPSGEVRPLLWVRQYRRRFNRTYQFREPMLLPKGTRVVVHSAAPAAVRLTATPGPAR